MATDVFIYSSFPLRDARQGLEDDLDDMLGDAGEVTGGGSGGAGWNIDVEILVEAEANSLVSQIAAFLRDYPVPSDTHMNVAVADGLPIRFDVFSDQS